MIERFADWFNSRRWFIRSMIYAELATIAPLITLIIANSL
jgi:hypothetical protein